MKIFNVIFCRQIKFHVTITGLKFKNPLTNCYRVVKLDEKQKFHAPGITQMDEWGCDVKDLFYICTFPRAAESANVSESTAPPVVEAAATSPKLDDKIANLRQQTTTIDLIVLQLSSATTESELRTYFESNFGPLIMSEIKRDRQTGNSRRFAFIRFLHYKDQMKALAYTKHKLAGQQLRVALPDYRDPIELYRENKCFIGRVNEAIKAADLREFFSQFGEIEEISYPKKFKGYAFITFADREVAQKLCGNDFIVKGYSLCVSKSTNGGGQQMQQQMNHVTPPNSHQNPAGGDWNWFRESKAFNVTRPHPPGPSPFIDPRNNSNFYGNPAAMMNQNNPLNVLTMAMGNLLTNQMGTSANRQVRPQQLWHPNNNPEQKKKKNKKKNPKKPQQQQPTNKVDEGEKLSTEIAENALEIDTTTSTSN